MYSLVLSLLEIKHLLSLCNADSWRFLSVPTISRDLFLWSIHTFSVHSSLRYSLSIHPPQINSFMSINPHLIYSFISSAYNIHPHLISSYICDIFIIHPHFINSFISDIVFIQYTSTPDQFIYQ